MVDLSSNSRVVDLSRCFVIFCKILLLLGSFGRGRFSVERVDTEFGIWRVLTRKFVKPGLMPGPWTLSLLYRVIFIIHRGF